MSYLEQKMEFLVKAAKEYCGTESSGWDLRHQVAVDVMDCCGLVFSRRDPALLKNMGALISIFPLLKKDAVGVFKNRVEEMEDACINIQVELAKLKNKKK